MSNTTSNVNVTSSGGSNSKQNGKQPAVPFQGGGYYPPPQQQQQPYQQLIPTAATNQSSPSSHPIPHHQHVYYAYAASPPPVYHPMPHHAPQHPTPPHQQNHAAQYPPPVPSSNGESSSTAQPPAVLNNSSPSTAVGNNASLGTPGTTPAPAPTPQGAPNGDSTASKNSAYSNGQPQLVPQQAPPPAYYPHHPHQYPPSHAVYHPVYASPPRDATQTTAGQHPMPPHTPSYWVPAHHPHHHPHMYPHHAARYAPPPPPHVWSSVAGAPSSASHLNSRRPPLSHHPIAPRPVMSPSKLKSPLMSLRLPKKSKKNDADGREGAKSPSEIETHHRDEVEHMGCTCKKTRCLKLYCQCFGIKIYCGTNCRCLQCYNSTKHEKQRKEAMRSILSRNPTAFDTKFRKTGEMVPVAKAVIDNNSPPSSGKDDGTRAIAHKLGCKCRKSACMKKYCECYAGHVKCNASCRCMGCKNVGPSVDYRGGPPEGNAITMAAPAPAPYPMHHQMPPRPSYRPMPPPIPSAAPPAANSEPWVAAQSLTFLKRGSPASDRTGGSASKASPGMELTSMPSLASSSEGTSPGDANHYKVTAVAAAAASTPASKDEERSGADALLMAAAAMTEFANSPPPSLQKLSAAFRRKTSSRTMGNEDIGTSKRSISFSESSKRPTRAKKVKAVP